MVTLQYSRWDTPEGILLRDVEGQYEDIQSARSLLVRFLIEVRNRDFVLVDALATASVVRYARAFATGIRQKIRLADIPGLTPEQHNLHAEVLAIRSRYSAHAVNMQETNSIYVGHVATPDGNPTVTSVSSGTLTTIAISVDQAVRLEALCSLLLSHLNGVRTIESARLLELALKNLSPDQIRALPVGPVPTSNDPFANRPR